MEGEAYICTEHAYMLFYEKQINELNINDSVTNVDWIVYDILCSLF